MDKATTDKILKLFEKHVMASFGVGLDENSSVQLEDGLSNLDARDVLEELEAAFAAGYVLGLEARHVR